MGKINKPSKYSVVILAAGIGKRLNIPGFSGPKCLLEIDGKTLIQSQLENLAKRGFVDISMVVGYRHLEIINTIKKYKNLPKINFIKINKYSINGHGLTLFKYRKKWNIDKKPIIMLHADLYFKWKYFDEVFNDSHENILGLTSYKFNQTSADSLAIGINAKGVVTAINHKKNMKKPLGQVLCINKISSEMTQRLFGFMNSYFKINNYKKHPWEIVFNNFINRTKAEFFTTKPKKYPWFNINKIDDYLAAKEYD